MVALPPPPMWGSSSSNRADNSELCFKTASCDVGVLLFPPRQHFLPPANHSQAQAAPTYPKMLEMESSRLGGGWEIFLLLQPRRAR